MSTTTKIGPSTTKVVVQHGRMSSVNEGLDPQASDHMGADAVRENESGSLTVLAGGTVVAGYAPGTWTDYRIVEIAPILSESINAYAESLLRDSLRNGFVFAPPYSRPSALLAGPYSLN